MHTPDSPLDHRMRHSLKLTIAPKLFAHDIRSSPTLRLSYLHGVHSPRPRDTIAARQETIDRIIARECSESELHGEFSSLCLGLGVLSRSRGLPRVLRQPRHCNCHYNIGKNLLHMRDREALPINVGTVVIQALSEYEFGHVHESRRYVRDQPEAQAPSFSTTPPFMSHSTLEKSSILHHLGTGTSWIYYS